MIPLALKLKREGHKKVAAAQDVVVEELYSVFNEAVLHGGTAIWRCYHGNRFSEDVDVYITRDQARIAKLFDNFEKRGLLVTKKRITENSIYSELKADRIFVRFEALFKKVQSVLMEYEKTDGTLISVYTLSAENFIEEKAAAYNNRLKVRDLYDIFFMMRYTTATKNVRKILRGLLGKKPIDEPELRVLIIEGLVPSTEKMFDYLKIRA